MLSVTSLVPRCWVWGLPRSQVLGVRLASFSGAGCEACLVPRCWVWSLPRSKVLGVRAPSFPGARCEVVVNPGLLQATGRWAGPGNEDSLLIISMQTTINMKRRPGDATLIKCWGPTLNHIPFVKHIKDYTFPCFSSLIPRFFFVVDDLGVA